MKDEASLPAYFVTGTDTGIGKTVASAALLQMWRSRGSRAVGMKPVASGCELTPQGWQNEDALALQAASDPVPAYADVNPYALEHPLAPELAAADAGIHIELGAILDAYARLRAQAGRGVVVVEGVGGWMAPITSQLDQKTLARELGLPVILVVGLRLGCINHARLTARAILDDGLPLAGWIANEIDPAMERIDDNFVILRRVLPAPCLGRIPHAAAVNASAMAQALDPERLALP